jgi:hypothetical protein
MPRRQILDHLDVLMVVAEGFAGAIIALVVWACKRSSAGAGLAA